MILISTLAILSSASLQGFRTEPAPMPENSVFFVYSLRDKEPNPVLAFPKGTLDESGGIAGKPGQTTRPPMPKVSRQAIEDHFPQRDWIVHHEGSSSYLFSRQIREFKKAQMLEAALVEFNAVGKDFVVDTAAAATDLAAYVREEAGRKLNPEVMDRLCPTLRTFNFAVFVRKKFTVEVNGKLYDDLLQPERRRVRSFARELAAKPLDLSPFWSSKEAKVLDVDEGKFLFKGNAFIYDRSLARGSLGQGRRRAMELMDQILNDSGERIRQLTQQAISKVYPGMAGPSLLLRPSDLSPDELEGLARSMLIAEGRPQTMDQIKQTEARIVAASSIRLTCQLMYCFASPGPRPSTPVLTFDFLTP